MEVLFLFTCLFEHVSTEPRWRMSLSPEPTHWTVVEVCTLLVCHVLLAASVHQRTRGQSLRSSTWFDCQTDSRSDQRQRNSLQQVRTPDVSQLRIHWYSLLLLLALFLHLLHLLLHLLHLLLHLLHHQLRTQRYSNYSHQNWHKLELGPPSDEKSAFGRLKPPTTTFKQPVTELYMKFKLN